MKFYKCLCALPFALMAASCSDENKSLIENEGEGTNQLKAVYLDSKTYNPNGIAYWAPGETIKYYVASYEKRQQKSLLYECIEEIQQYANIEFEEVHSLEESDVSFVFFSLNTNKVGNISNSCNHYNLIGKYQILENKKKYGQYYNYAIWTTEHTDRSKRLSDEVIKGSIFHELGHILGLNDERYHPNFNIPLKKDVVIAHFMKEGNSKAEAEKYYKRYYSPEARAEYGKNCAATKYFDRYSVMMDSIPAYWTTNGTCINRNTTLSNQDKRTLMQLYPFPSDLVPIFGGSALDCDAFIGTMSQYTDATYIRKRIGFGFKTQKPGTYPLYRFEKNLYSPEGEIYEYNVRFSFDKGNGKYNNGVTSEYQKTDLVAYVYDNVGDNKVALIPYYYKNTTKIAGVSTPNDKGLLNKGLTMGSYYFGAVLNNHRYYK